MTVYRFTHAGPQCGRARALAGLLSAFALLSLASCGGGDDGSGCSSNAVALAPSLSSSALSSSTTFSSTSTQTTWTAQSRSPDSLPPVDRLIVQLTGAPAATAARMMRAAGDASRIGGVIQRASAQWAARAAPAGNARICAARPSATSATPIAQVERTMSGNAIVLKLAQRMSADEAHALAQMFAADSDVAYAEPDRRMTVRGIPNDPGYGRQWYLWDPAVGINAPAAWNITKGSPSVVTAVIDTGYRPHADLNHNLVPGYSFISDASVSNNGQTRGPDATDPGDWITQQELEDPNGPFYRCEPEPSDSSWHGTLVAGVIGAAGNNGIGIAGISWHGKIQPVRALGKCGGATSDIVDAMRWAAGMPVEGVPANPTPAKIINLSLGVRGVCGRTFQQAVDDVTARGATVIAATGNEGLLTTINAPANCRGVIAVGATDAYGRRAPFSNHAVGVTLSAPGVDIMSTANSGKTRPLSDTYYGTDGTSLAAPQVSGVAALMLAVNGNLTPEQVREKLLASARPAKFAVGMPYVSTAIAPNTVDAAAAVNAAMQSR